MKVSRPLLGIAFSFLFPHYLFGQSAAKDVSPTVEDTLKYLNSKFQNGHNFRTSRIGISKNHETLYAEADEFLGNHWLHIRWDAPIMALEIGGAHSVESQDAYSIWLPCHAGTLCVHEQFPDGVSVDIPTIFAEGYPLDRQEANRLAQAYRYLIRLLQAEVTQKHQEERDPFAK